MFSYFDHNSLIRTRNRVIQKPKLLVLKRATKPMQFQSHLTSSFFPVHWFQSEVHWLYVKLLLFQFLLIISLILSIWLMKYVEKLVRSYARVVWLISWLSLALWSHLNIYLLDLILLEIASRNWLYDVLHVIF